MIALAESVGRSRREWQTRNAPMSQGMIAIVDDDAVVREAMKSLMRSLGYDASTFGSAEEFLNSEQISRTSCLITDLHMPGLSGLDLQDRLIAQGHRFVRGSNRSPLRAMCGSPPLAIARV